MDDLTCSDMLRAVRIIPLCMQQTHVSVRSQCNLVKSDPITPTITETFNVTGGRNGEKDGGELRIRTGCVDFGCVFCL